MPLRTVVALVLAFVFACGCSRRSEADDALISRAGSLLADAESNLASATRGGCADVRRAIERHQVIENRFNAIILGQNVYDGHRDVAEAFNSAADRADAIKEELAQLGRAC